MSAHHNNPLLSADRAPYDLSGITSAHIVPAIQALTDMVRTVRTTVESEQSPTWENTVVPLEQAHSTLDAAWSVIEQYHATCNTETFHTAYEHAQPLLVSLHSETAQSRPLYDAYCQLREKTDYTAAQYKVLDDGIRNFERAGVHKSDAIRDTVRAASMELAALGTRFSQNILDSMQSFSYTADADAVRGIPETVIKPYCKDGAYHLPLTQPVYQAVVRFADDRDVRKQFYCAWATRASSGAHDNSAILDDIRRTRKKFAHALDAEDYAHFVCSDYMAKTPHTVTDFLQDLAERATPTARKELAHITACAAQDGIKTLAPWDTAYYAEKHKKACFSFDEETLRPYFPLTTVFAGFTALIETLFGIRFVQQNNVRAWHDTVLLYALQKDGVDIAFLYCDLFARSEKRSGAWMADYIHKMRRADGTPQLPIAFINCNFTPPYEDTPALLTHDDVVTLFHECGHALHHLLTTQEHTAIAGINGVEWDAVELPSQFLENFAWETATLSRISSHYQTGESLSDEQITRLQQSRTYNGGLFLLRQIEFGLFDQAVHTNDTSDVLALLQDIRDHIAIVPTLAEDRFPMSFSHIFAGGYAAGYYSYLWAEVLAHDCYAPFQEKQHDDTARRAQGQHFLDAILSQGSVKSMADLFYDYRGRAPDSTALLRAYGIA